MWTASIFDRGRRETTVFMTLAVALVLIRCAVFLLHGYINYDSDQAIIGLMAKHLSEFRTFPLFYYGQNYLLGTQSWMIAPLFWIARPSIAVQKLPLVIINAGTAVLLMHLISSNLRVRPAIAFLAALPFIIPTPIIAANFLQSVEPLTYVLILWMLRRRPFAFGALLAFGFLQREFTMYALPALALVEIADGSFWTADRARRAAWAACGFALVWLIIDDLKTHLDGGSLILQAQQMGSFACFGGPGVFDRLRYVATENWPVLVGGTTMPLDHYGMRSSAVVGSAGIGWAASGVVLFMLVRLASLWRPGRPGDPGDPGDNAASIGFAVYLALVGLFALAAYSLTCAYDYPVIRYFTLGVLLATGCFAAFMVREPSAWLRRAVIVIFVLWGAANLVDNVRVIREASVNPHPDPYTELTEFLLSHQIRYARASYWDSYVVDFLSRERVIIGSDGPVRIPEYERLVNAHDDAAVRIARMPCEGPMHVAVWCIQLPVNRPGEGAR